MIARFSLIYFFCYIRKESFMQKTKIFVVKFKLEVLELRDQKTHIFDLLAVKFPAVLFQQMLTTF